MRASTVVALSVCILLVCGGWPATPSEGTQGIPSLRQWASAQPGDRTPDGREIPVCGMPYFREYGTGSANGGNGARATARWAPVLRITGTHCRIFVDATVNGSFSDAYLQNLGAEFDNHIWAVDTSVFGTPGCSTIDIYIYPIDGMGGVGGYFNGGNALYADSSDTSWMDEILAHELQHLIHYYKDNREDLWVNEGCADLAIQLCYGYDNNTTSLGSHIRYFQSTPDNDLTVFQNQLYDYGSAYAFLSYFHEHFGGNATIKALVADKARGASGFNNRLSGTGQNFTSVFRNWTVANFMNDRGIGPAFGYTNLTIRVDASRVKTYPLSMNGSVQRWAADYFNFTAEGSDLEIDFNGSDSAPLEVWLGLVGTGANNSSVQKMALNAARDGFILVPRLGIDISSVVMVVSASSAAANYSFTANAYDRTPPVTTINITPPLPDLEDGCYLAPPTITLTVDEKWATIYYHWDDGTDIPLFGALSAPEGKHTLHFHSVDAAGNREGERLAVFLVDTTAPTTELSVKPAQPDGRAGWYRTFPRLELAGEVGARILYSWDGGAEENYTTFILAPEGVHTLYYRSVDIHGIEGAVRMAAFKVDTQPPTFKIYIDPSSPDGLNGWYLRIPTVHLDTEPESELFYHWNSEEQARYSGPIRGREGRNLFSCYAVDPAGNRQSPVEVEMRVDTHAPRCEALVSPPEPDGLGGLYRTGPSILLASEPGAEIFYRWDHGKWYYYPEPLSAPEGAHSLSYYSVDEAGNPSPEQSLQLDVDTVPPQTALSFEPEQGYQWYTEAPAVSLTTSPDATAFYCMDGGAPSAYGGRMALVAGTHHITYWGVDAAGNEGARLTRVIRIDMEDPVASLSVPGPYSMEGLRSWFDGSCSHDLTSGVASFRFVFGDGEESGWASSPVVWHAYMRAGEYRASLTVRDAAGRESAQTILTVTVKAPGAAAPAEGPPGASTDYSAAGAAGAALLFLAVLAAWALGRRGKKAQGARRRGPEAADEAVDWDEDSLNRPKAHPNSRRGGR